MSLQPPHTSQPGAPRSQEDLFEELAAAAALGALHPDDLPLWENLRNNRPQDPLPSALARAATALAWTLPLKNPPARCRAAVLEAVARRAAPPESPAPPRARFTFDSLLPWAAVAIFAFASAFMAAGLARQKQEIAALRSQIFGPLQLRKAMLRPADPSSPAVARLVFCATVQQGRLVVEGLEPCPRGKAYQLWLAPEGAQPVPVALFRVDETRHAAIDFTPPCQLSGVARAMVSIEDASGASSPTGPVLLAGQ